MGVIRWCNLFSLRKKHGKITLRPCVAMGQTKGHNNQPKTVGHGGEEDGEGGAHCGFGCAIVGCYVLGVMTESFIKNREEEWCVGLQWPTLKGEQQSNRSWCVWMRIIKQADARGGSVWGGWDGVMCIPLFEMQKQAHENN